jgi:succinate dehydrogenase / fumarate reductase membrane anchor subunit
VKAEMIDSAQLAPTDRPALRPSWGYDAIAWRWMRYSAFLLIPLAFGHILLQDILVGVHAIDLSYVAARWANLGWRIYDAFLLVFAFAHGMNGLRQVISDYLSSNRARQAVSWLLLAIWLVISAAGTIALVGGVR